MKNKIKLWQWIVLVALTGSVPLVIISSLLIHNSINKSISFSEQEVRGDAFQGPLEQLLDLLPRHQAAARKALEGNDSGKQSMSEIQRLADSAFAANWDRR